MYTLHFGQPLFFFCYYFYIYIWVIVFFLTLDAGEKTARLKHSKWKFCGGSIIQDWDGGRSRRTRRSETGAPEGIDLPNVLVKPKIFITHLRVIPNL